MKRGWIIGIAIIIAVVIVGIILVRTGVTGSLVSPLNVPCSDSDGGVNIYEQGVASLTSNGVIISEADSCSGLGYVLENSCKENKAMSETFVTTTRIECDGLCEDGACVK